MSGRVGGTLGHPSLSLALSFSADWSLKRVLLLQTLTCTWLLASAALASQVTEGAGTHAAARTRDEGQLWLSQGGTGTRQVSHAHGDPGRATE